MDRAGEAAHFALFGGWRELLRYAQLRRAEDGTATRREIVGREAARLSFWPRPTGSDVALPLIGTHDHLEMSPRRLCLRTAARRQFRAVGDRRDFALRQRDHDARRFPADGGSRLEALDRMVPLGGGA